MTRLGIFTSLAGAGFLLAAFTATHDAIFAGGILLGVPLAGVGILLALTPSTRR